MIYLYVIFCFTERLLVLFCRLKRINSLYCPILPPCVSRYTRFSLEMKLYQQNNPSKMLIILAWEYEMRVLPHKVHVRKWNICLSGWHIYGTPVCKCSLGTSVAAHSWPRLVTITIQGDSRTNQLRALTRARLCSYSQTRRGAEAGLTISCSDCSACWGGSGLPHASGIVRSCAQCFHSDNGTATTPAWLGHHCRVIRWIWAE